FRGPTNQGTPAVGAGALNGVLASHPVSIDSIVSLGGYQFKVITREPHFRTRNNPMRIGGVNYIDTSTMPSTLRESQVFNGFFSVDDYDPALPMEFKYTVTKDPATEAFDRTYDSAYANAGHIAIACDNGTAAVVEGNRVFHCDIGGPYHDTFATRDLA